MRLQLAGVMFFCVLIDLLISGCSPQRKHEDLKSKSIGIDMFLDNILGKNIKDIKLNHLVTDSYVLSDTILEDEGVDWKALSVEDNKKELIALLETNWEDSITISRIRLFSPDINKNGYHVNSSFASIQNVIDEKRLNESPDGELGLISKSDSRIHFLMDLPENSSLRTGVGSIKDIPSDLK